MSQLLLINPSPRKGKTMAKAKRSAAQVRATRKLVALNKARAKGSHAKPAHKRRSNPIHAAAVHAPTKRRKYKRTTAVAARAAGRTLRHRRKNPIGGIGDFVTHTVVPSAIGGAGALALDVLIGALPIPVQYKSGAMAPVIKIVGALGLGMLASKVASRKVGEQVAAGAVTVALYNVAKGALAKSGLPGLSEYVSEYTPGIGMYPDGALGFTNAGVNVGDLMPDGTVHGFESGVYR